MSLIALHDVIVVVIALESHLCARAVYSTIPLIPYATQRKPLLIANESSEVIVRVTPQTGGQEGQEQLGDMGHGREKCQELL